MPEEGELRGRDPRVATKGGEAAEAPTFETPYPRTYGRPDPDRLKRAFWAYVQGHDRGWGAERKRRTAETFLEGEELERGRRRALEGAPEEPEGGATPSGLAAAADDRPAVRASAARFGVPVPERLDYHRGPDTWRERIGRTPGTQGQAPGKRGRSPGPEGESSGPGGE